MLPCRKHAFNLKPPGLISLFPKSQNMSRLWQRDKRKSKAEVILQHRRRVPSRPQIYPIFRFHHHSSVSITSINICSHPSAAWLQSCTCNQATAGGLCAWLIVNDRSPNKHQKAASPHRSLSGILNGAELSREWKRHRVQCGQNWVLDLLQMSRRSNHKCEKDICHYGDLPVPLWFVPAGGQS